MYLKTILNFAGSLLPIIFPKQEFRPKRLAAAVLGFFIIIASVKYIGAEDTGAALDLLDDFIELTEE